MLNFKKDVIFMIFNDNSMNILHNCLFFLSHFLDQWKKVKIRMPFHIISFVHLHCQLTVATSSTKIFQKVPVTKVLFSSLVSLHMKSTASANREGY